jgi:hypothetical protein
MLNKIEEKFERVFEWLNEDGDDALKMSIVFGSFIVLIGLAGLCC